MKSRLSKVFETLANGEHNLITPRSRNPAKRRAMSRLDKVLETLFWIGYNLIPPRPRDTRRQEMAEQLCGRCGVNPVSEDPDDVLEVDGELVRVCSTCW